MRSRLCLLLLASILFSATPLAAHHSLADYDLNHPFTVTGTVTKIEWMNPHAWLYIDVEPENAASNTTPVPTEHWAFEFGSPSESIRRGWTRQDLKIGDKVTVQGVPAKRGGNTASARSIKFPTGKEVFTAAHK